MVFSIGGAIAAMTAISGTSPIVMAIFALGAAVGIGIFGHGCVERLRLRPAQTEQQASLPSARALGKPATPPE